MTIIKGYMDPKKKKKSILKPMAPSWLFVIQAIFLDDKYIQGMDFHKKILRSSIVTGL